MATLKSTNALIEDPVGGFLTASHGIVYYLTPCCGASGKGSADSATGVVCRACYEDVDPTFGMGWAIDDEQGWQHYERLLTAELGAESARRVAEDVRTRAVARQSSQPG